MEGGGQIDPPRKSYFQKGPALLLLFFMIIYDFVTRGKPAIVNKKMKKVMELSRN